MTNIKMVCWPYGPKYSSDAGRRRLYKSSAGIGSYWRNIFALGGHPCVHFDGTLGYANQYRHWTHRGSVFIWLLSRRRSIYSQ